MSRNLVTLGAFLLVAGVLWVVTEWPAPKEEVAPLAAADPSSVVQPPVVAPPPAAAPPAAYQPAPEPEPEPAPAPAADPPAPVKPRQLPDQIQGDQGPVAEYRAQFQSEPRNSTAIEVESALRGAFQPADGAPDLIKSVLCRQTICRIEMRWSQERMRAYVVGFTRLNKRIQIPVALSPVGPKAKDGVQLVEVYMKLKPPGTPAPADHEH
ncbi:MAG TPA: hypothetical protein VJV78_01495 [Polyangiales bacterium]|nr:hypothetical protein [Polyangiales bacterium]